MDLRDPIETVLAWRMAPIEVAGTLLSVAAVLLTIKRSVWCWPVWILATVLYVVVFAGAKLYSDVLLQFFFLAMQIAGWLAWGKADSAQTLPVGHLTPRERWIWGTVAVLGAAVWGWGMDTFTDAAAAYPDAFVAIGSVVAQWLQTRKRVESWIGWIVVDIVATGVYWSKGLHPTAELYVGFTILAIVGWRDWRREWLRSRATDRKPVG